MIGKTETEFGKNDEGKKDEGKKGGSGDPDTQQVTEEEAQRIAKELEEWTKKHK